MNDTRGADVAHVRPMWRFLHRLGAVYVFARDPFDGPFRYIPVAQFWSRP